MRLELKRKEPIGNAIPGELFADGLFFGYTLENADYSFPSGVYDLYERNSPKHGYKVHISVPGRENIMFHGANVAGELLGCVAVAYSRPTKETLFGDISNELYDDFAASGKSGVLVVTNPGEKSVDFPGWVWVVVGVGAFYLLTRNKHK